MNKLVLKSPAKLNLYLNVLRKRPDGYHDIETIFEKISLFDIVTIRPENTGIKITTDNPALPTGRRNLAYKAARILFDKTGFKGGVRINIKKNIPVCSGLGGGSSNAATVLSGVNRLFRLGLKRSELIEIGRAIGADVPFFLHDCSFAIGRNKGDDVAPIYNDVIIWHIIIPFTFGCETKRVYGDLTLGLTPNIVDVTIFRRFLMRKDIENLAASLYNKLEEVVFKKAEIIGSTKSLLLEKGAYGALLSGSGSAIFGITKTREEAIAVRRRVNASIGSGSKALIVKTFN